MDTGYKERAYVVFQGGGALGIAHFGAWQAIDKNFEIIGVAGTSSGSIVAALCAAGFSPNEAFESFKRDLSELVDHKSFRWSIIDIASRVLLGRNASSDGSGFKNYLERQLEQSKLKKRDITFEELYQYKQIHLEIVACDLKNPDHPPIIFSPKENKSTSISIAVRASISLPGFFTPVRMGNWELGDGGFKLNFPIENFYEQAKKEDCALIGVRFKKSQRSFNSSNSRQVVLKGYDLFTSNSSKVPDEIRSYLKCQIIEIDDDLGCNPLDFNLSKEQLLKLRKAGEEVARKQLEELQNRLTEVKSRRYSQLPPSIRKSVEEAQRWFSYEAIPRIEDYCKRTLSLDKFRNLEIDERKTKLFYWEVEKYLVRISESLLAQRYDLLQYKLLRPSLSNLDVYLEILDLIKREIPEYLMAKQEVKERIDYLKEKIIQQFSNP